MQDVKYHLPVLVKEILAHLKQKDLVIDATLGTGGHAEAMLKKGCQVIGIEADSEMLAIARKRLEQKAILINDNFRNLDRIAEDLNLAKVDAILFDLGVSNLQLNDPKRGFSFKNPSAPLDLRINPKNQGVTGADLLNALREDQLFSLFSEVLNFSSSKWLVKRILTRRELLKFETVSDFLEVCEGIRSKSRINEATLPFLALRIAVNLELDNLKIALPKALTLLKSGGSLLIITFHSAEEKILCETVGHLGKPILPSFKEVRNNPRSRSAKLFVIKK